MGSSAVGTGRIVADLGSVCVGSAIDMGTSLGLDFRRHDKCCR